MVKKTKKKKQRLKADKKEKIIKTLMGKKMRMKVIS